MQQMEDICNELIRQGKCVSVQVVKDPADLKDVCTHLCFLIVAFQ